jgi:hypothetical protein
VEVAAITEGDAWHCVHWQPDARSYEAHLSPRLSAAELRQEMNAYLDARHRAGKAPGTVNTDKAKISAFLQWLESGEISE